MEPSPKTTENVYGAINGSASNSSAKPPLPTSGIYTGRLRNNSERSEKSAHEKECNKEPKKGKPTPKKITKKCSSASNSSLPIAPNSPADIRSFITIHGQKNVLTLKRSNSDGCIKLNGCQPSCYSVNNPKGEVNYRSNSRSSVNYNLHSCQM